MKTIEEVIKNKAILISSETAQELDDYLKRNKSKTKQPNKLLKRMNV